MVIVSHLLDDNVHPTPTILEYTIFKLQNTVGDRLESKSMAILHQDIKIVD